MFRPRAPTICPLSVAPTMPPVLGPCPQDTYHHTVPRAVFLGFSH